MVPILGNIDSHPAITDSVIDWILPIGQQQRLDVMSRYRSQRADDQLMIVALR